MTQLNQIVALEKGVKSRASKAITEIYKKLQKTDLFHGLSRVYTPRAEGDEQLPPESVRVQLTVEDQLAALADTFAEMFDVVYTKECANTEAKADVKVGDRVVATGVPITYLLFVEKQLTDWHTALTKVPVLNPADEWIEDNANGGFRTAPVATLRTKKVPRNHVKAEATDKHPAQVDVYYEDIQVGTWALTKFSGAIPAAKRDVLITRVDRLIDAVKSAREEANSMTIEQKKIGEKFFDFLLS